MLILIYLPIRTDTCTVTIYIKQQVYIVHSSLFSYYRYQVQGAAWREILSNRNAWHYKLTIGHASIHGGLGKVSL